MEEAWGVIKKSEDGKWCIHMSDGRKECFSSRKAAEKRERQINYFKHKSANINTEDLYAISKLDIFAIHRDVENNRTIFMTNDNHKVNAFLITKNERDEISIEKLDAEHKLTPNYQSILNVSTVKLAQANEKVFLSSAVIEGQLLENSHTHTLDLSMVNLRDGYGMGVTSEEHNHTHTVDILPNGCFYVSYSPMDLGGVKISHTHLVVIKLGEMN